MSFQEQEVSAGRAKQVQVSFSQAHRHPPAQTNATTLVVSLEKQWLADEIAS